MNFPLKKIWGSSLALMVTVTMVSAQTAMNVGNLPLWFEAGQGDSAGQFIARGRDAEFSVSSAGGRFVLRKADGQISAVSLKFVGAEAAPKIYGESEMTGKVSRFIGNNPAGWQSGNATFARIRLENVYPGVNAVFYGNQQKLEYDLNLAAGVNPGGMGIQYQGAEKLSVNARGELVIGLNGGEVIQHQPVAYQTGSDGTRHEVEAGYKILDADTVQFVVADYDHNLPLVLDPILGYSTYFGGNGNDAGWAIALGSNNHIYIAGQTFSTLVSNSIPFATTNAAQTNNNSGGSTSTGDAFVAELDGTGTNLLYCTYLGGSVDDAIYGIAVDGQGYVYVTGATSSPDFPVKDPFVYGSYKGTNIGGVVDRVLKTYLYDAFITKLDTNGSHLIYSSYLGGEATDFGYGIALDSAGDAFVTGETTSTNFPVTSDAYFATLQCTNNYYVNANAFVTEIASNGATLIYSTYLGGTNFDFARGIAYNNGYVYVVGKTYSQNFPWVRGLTNCPILNNFSNTPNNFDSSFDAFVTVFTTANTSPHLNLLYSTFLGSTNNDQATGVAGDGLGNAYVVGWTASSNFPNTTLSGTVSVPSFVRTNATGLAVATNAFFTQIKYGTNATLGYSQIFGSSFIDEPSGVARDAAGDVFIVGTTLSLNFPTTTNLVGSLRTTNSTASSTTSYFTDIFVTAFKADFSSLLYSAYTGGSGYHNNAEFGNAIAVDGAGNAYITGQTYSIDFPTIGGYQKVLDGTSDAYIMKILPASAPPATLSVSGTNVQVSWPLAQEASTNYFSLQSNTNLASTNWVAVPQSPVLTNGTYIFTFTPTNPADFFRIQKK